MKKVLTFILFLSFLKGFSCSCIMNKPIVEFLNSEYVFEGDVISKVYLKSSKSYKITFQVAKHYKEGDMPKRLEFVIPAEYFGKNTSCAWEVSVGERRLVFAGKDQDDGRLYFSGVCSNSQRINENWKLKPSVQKMLKNIKNFRFEDYFFEREYGFEVSQEGDFDFSELEVFDTKNRISVGLVVDTEGDLVKIGKYGNIVKKHDPNFDLYKEIVFEEKPLTDFEQKAIEIVSSKHKWGIMKHKKTQKEVAYVGYLYVFFDREKGKWSCQF